MKLEFMLKRAAQVGNLDTVKQRLTDYNPSMDTGELAGYVMLVAAKEGQLNVVQWLLAEKCANVSFIGDGASALMHAAACGQLHTVQWLVNHAMAFVDQIGPSGLTALLVASRCRKLEVVKWLVNTGGCNIDHADICNKTALLYAARWGSLDTVKFLVKTSGSNIEHVDKFGMNALLLAVLGRNHDIANWLLTEGGCCMHEDVWLYLHPESGEIPSFLMHTLLLEGPPNKIIGKTKITKRMFARSDKLRTRKPEWIIRKFAIVTESITRNLPESLVKLVMAYSVPSVEEIWSTQLDVDSPRRNAIRATRKRHASSSW